MLASEYKNCFWNASGDLSCPAVNRGYSGPTASEYPNWKLYNNVNLSGVEAYSNKGYQTDYESAHIGTRTMDHYYNLEPKIQRPQRQNGSMRGSMRGGSMRGGGSMIGGSMRGNNKSRPMRQTTLNPQMYQQRPNHQGMVGGGTCESCQSSPYVNKYTAYKYMHDPSTEQLKQLQAHYRQAQTQQYLDSQQIHCQQQFGGHQQQQQFVNQPQFGGHQQQQQFQQQLFNDHLQFARKQFGGVMGEQFGGVMGDQFAGADDYDSSLFKRPNMHGLGGSGWGDAQIMQEGSVSGAEDIQQGGFYYEQGYPQEGYVDSQQQHVQANIQEIQDNGRYDTNYADAATTPYVGKLLSGDDKITFGKNNKMKQSRLTSYSYSVSNPERLADNPQSNYSSPTYITDYYKNCDEPDPANMTARQQYDNMLGRYNDPGRSTELGYYNQNPNAFNTNNNQATIQSFVQDNGIGLTPNSYANQFMITNNAASCYDVYSKKGDEPLQAPSYASLLMFERPYLNPNPYAIYQPSNSNSNNSVVPYNSGIGSAQFPYNGFGSGNGNMFGQSGGFQGFQGTSQGAYQGASQGTYQGAGQNQNQGSVRVPGQELLAETSVSYKERLLKMLGEIGQPIGLSRGKNGIRAIWHGDLLKAPYANCFHRVYLNYNDAYPVMTVSRIKNIDEDMIAKLGFICDRFKVVPVSGSGSSLEGKKGKKEKKDKAGKDSLLILRGPSFKSNLAKTALALSAIKGKITFCQICDDELGKKWVWALNPSSQKFFDPKAKVMYSKLCNSLARN